MARAKSPDAFRTISEVADWLGVQAHVLRFWESKFHQVKPVKRAGGRRYYRPSDMRLLGGIKKLLHDDGLTIKGVQKILREQGVAHVSELSPPIDAAPAEAARDVTPAAETADRGQPPDTVVPFKAPAAPPADADARQMGLDLDHPPAPQTAAPTPPGDMAEPAAKADDAPRPAALDDTASGTDTADTDATRATPESPDISSPAPRARPLDLADPPPEERIECPPGPLARLARLDRLNAALARELAPIAQDLRAVLDRRRAPTAD